jgi:hypothetical protein
MKRPKLVNATTAQLEALWALAKTSFPPRQYELLEAVLGTFVYVTQALQNAHSSIKRLRQMLFGTRTEKTAQVFKAVSAAVTEQGASPPSPSPPAAAPEAPAREGHGRNGARAYTGATKIKVKHPDLHCGQLCPQCRRGKLYAVATPGTLVRVTGQAALSASVYEFEKLRCNLCLQVFTAQPPEGIGSHTHDAGAGQA